MRREGGLPADTVYTRKGPRGIFGGAVFQFYTAANAGIASAEFRAQTLSMKALAGLLLSVALLFGIYEYALKRMPVSDEGTAPTQAISLTGVRSDLLQIAQAERTYVATNGSCVSLSELISTNTLAMTHTERDGYAYTVTCAAADFSVSGRHAPAPAGSPIRYPNLAIDQSMQIAEVP